MPEFKDIQKYEGQEKPVIKEYKEMNRDGSSYTADREPSGRRMDFLPQIKRKFTDRIK